MRKVLTTVLTAGLLLIAVPANAHVLPHSKQCRMQQLDHASWTHHEVVRTVECFGRRFGDRTTALRVGNCESSLTAEKAPHSTSYHGTYQYAKSTFHSQQHMIRKQVRKYQLSHHVHNPRANVGTAVIWASKHGWSPWSCY